MKRKAEHFVGEDKQEKHLSVTSDHRLDALEEGNTIQTVPVDHVEALKSPAGEEDSTKRVCHRDEDADNGLLTKQKPSPHFFTKVERVLKKLEEKESSFERRLANLQFRTFMGK